MIVENITSSNSTKVWYQARIKLNDMASGSTIRLTTECPSGSGKTRISCKHEVLSDVLKLS